MMPTTLIVDDVPARSPRNSGGPLDPSRTTGREALMMTLPSAHSRHTVDVATLSHELRDPLHTILTLSHLLQQRVDGPAEVRRSLAEHIGANGRELLDLINSLIALTRVRDGREPVEVTPMSVQDAVHSAVTTLRRSRPTTEITGTWATNLPALRSDPGLVRQMVIALGEHALRSSADGAPVKVTVAAAGSREVHVSVSYPRPTHPVTRSAQPRADLALDLAEGLAGLLGGRVGVLETDGTRSLSVTLRAL